MSVSNLPKELMETLAGDPSVMVNFKKLSTSHKKEYIDWVSEAKRTETRYYRSQQIYQAMSTEAEPNSSTGDMARNQKALVSKLELTSGMVGRAVDAPFNYAQLLAGDTNNIIFLQDDQPNLDFVHVFCQNYQNLYRALSVYPQLLKPKGMIWISWPGQDSDAETDLTKQVIADTAATIAWSASKATSIDNKWSALKLTRAS